MKNRTIGTLLIGAVLALMAARTAAQRITNATAELKATPPTLTLHGVGFGQATGSAYLVIDGTLTPLDLVDPWADNVLRTELPTTVAGTYLAIIEAAGESPAFFSFTLGAQVAVANFAPPEESGQIGCWDLDGNVIPCAGTGQDGEFRKGVKWPVPRFTDRGDGTVLDHLTNLIWLQDWECLGKQEWDVAVQMAAQLAEGQCGLGAGYEVGDFAIPNAKEMGSLIDYSNGDCLPTDHPFNFTSSGDLWTGTTHPPIPINAWSFGPTTPILACLLPKIKAQGNHVAAVYKGNHP